MKDSARFKTYGMWLIAILLFLSQSALAQAAKIAQISITNLPNVTRFIFEITGGPFRYQWKFFSNTKQLNLNFENTVLATKLPKAELATTPVQTFLVKNQVPLEFILQLKNSVDIKISTQPVSDNTNKNRVIVDLKSSKDKAVVVSQKKPQPSAKVTAKVTTTKLASVTPAAPQPSVKSSIQKNTVITDTVELASKTAEGPAIKVNDKAPVRSIMVVIDPGHGGKDSGAVGPGNIREKDVVLAISKLLQKTFKQQPGFDAELTRYRDIFIPLRQRLTIARKCKADIFIAIHADAAYKNQDAVGASVFALSERGATSEGARWLAQKENESELIHGVVVDKDQLLRSVLLDLSLTHTIAVSLEMGQSILAKLSVFSKLHYTRVEQAAFVVLKSPDIPSLLVETGYISNPIQERNLQDPKYQQQIANAIVQGVVAYFMQHPPGKRLITS